MGWGEVLVGQLLILEKLHEMQQVESVGRQGIGRASTGGKVAHEARNNGNRLVRVIKKVKGELMVQIAWNTLHTHTQLAPQQNVVFLPQRTLGYRISNTSRTLGQFVYIIADLVQETFFRLVRNARSYRYPEPFLPWLYSIARYLALNYQQSAYHRHVDREADLPQTLADDVDPQVEVERQERHADLLKALGHLSLEQREVLSLRFGQELSVKETAGVLGVAAGTVKSRTFSALRLLRAYLESTTLQQTERRS
jgi:RNA polymerase sigma factor (sigma-70 family)